MSELFQLNKPLHVCQSLLWPRRKTVIGYCYHWIFIQELQNLLVYIINQRLCLTTIPKTKKRVDNTIHRVFLFYFKVSGNVVKHGIEYNLYIFSIQTQEGKLRRKQRKKNCKNLCLLKLDIQTPSCWWFPLFKLDELWMILRMRVLHSWEWLGRTQTLQNPESKTLLVSITWGS